MLHRKATVMGIGQKLLTDKCFSVPKIQESKKLIQKALKDRPVDITEYFTKSQCSVTIKEEEVHIQLNKQRVYRAKFHYITINDIPRLFIVPEEKLRMIHFLEKNHEIEDKIYWFILYNWLKNNKSNFGSLKKLYHIFDDIHSYVSSKLYRGISYCSIKFSDIPIEMVNAVKEKFFELHYDAVFQETLYESGYEILKDMGLLNKESKGRNSNVELQDFYKKNEYFRNKIDKIVHNKLEHIWSLELNNRNFKNHLIHKFKRGLTSDNCDIDKNIDIAFHNETMRLLFQKKEDFTTNLIINDITFKLDLIIFLRNNTNIINWLYSYLAETIGYPLLSIDRRNSRTYLYVSYSRKNCLKIYGKIKSYKVRYKVQDEQMNKMNIIFDDIVADCIAPRDQVIYMRINLEKHLKLELDKQNKYLWLNNDRAVLNKLIGLYKIVDKMLKIYAQINGRPLLAFGFAADYKDMDYL